jgi:hypothetical protein
MMSTAMRAQRIAPVDCRGVVPPASSADGAKYTGPCWEGELVAAVPAQVCVFAGVAVAVAVAEAAALGETVSVVAEVLVQLCVLVGAAEAPTVGLGELVVVEPVGGVVPDRVGLPDWLEVAVWVAVVEWLGCGLVRASSFPTTLRASSWSFFVSGR